MLTSLALIFLLGMLLGFIFRKLKLPSLLGMLLAGMALGPYALNLLDESILNISPDLRQLALIIILTRAGLSMDIKDLKKVGRPAVLMCFIPSCFEIAGFILFAPKLLGVSVLDAAIMGSVLAAVSLAVTVPKMLELTESGYGADKNIPQLIMAGSSIDNVFAIVLFASFTQLAASGGISLSDFAGIPVSVITGLIFGVLLGLGLSVLFKRFHIRDSAKVLILLGISFLLIEAEHLLKGFVPMSGLLAVLAMNSAVMKTCAVPAKRLSARFSKLWVAAEILLFVLVGAAVDIRYVLSAGGMPVLMIFIALLFRTAGVFICLIKTSLHLKERLFCAAAYMPKATVQAAIGAVPLSMGLSCGQIVLTVSVLSILITAPLGAALIDASHQKLLTHDKS